MDEVVRSWCGFTIVSKTSDTTWTSYHFHCSKSLNSLFIHTLKDVASYEEHTSPQQQPDELQYKKNCGDNHNDIKNKVKIVTTDHDDKVAVVMRRKSSKQNGNKLQVCLKYVIDVDRGFIVLFFSFFTCYHITALLLPNPSPSGRTR